MFNSGTAFYKAALKSGTDKVVAHSYEDAYSKYFELMPRRSNVNRMFEIGLGCTMEYGPGASSKLWREYFPQSTVIWQAEFEAECANKSAAKLEALGIKVVTGDQGDAPTLKRWISETGGNFDVIIDDGGHKSMQQFNSFMVLFEHALRPGGAYFLEDLHVSRSWLDGDKKHVMIDVIKEWMEGLVMHPKDDDNKYAVRFRPPPRIKAIDCFSGICVFTKCYAHDKRCDTLATDHGLMVFPWP